ncbi:hypothetical protein D3C80_1614850 [compost metagenome]
MLGGFEQGLGAGQGVDEQRGSVTRGGIERVVTVCWRGAGVHRGQSSAHWRSRSAGPCADAREFTLTVARLRSKL